MQLQNDPRVRKRVPCKLRSGGREHSGMVLNLSRGGLFVQTGAHVAPGDQVEVELNFGREQSGIPVDAQVVWRRSVAPQLRAVTQGGFGVRIRTAPENYFQLLSRAMDGSTGSLTFAALGPASGAKPKSTAATAAPAPSRSAAPKPAPKTQFRVRLQQTAGPRTRWVSVQATSEAEASKQALRETGEGWSVLECQPATT